MPNSLYTAITFAPVQGFIEKSRKLRDLYGSSYILSHLAEKTCQAALCHGLEVISPALIDVAKGTPNNIIIKGDFPKKDARQAFNLAWGEIVDRCRSWIETNLPDKYNWDREWKHWRNYTWEFFWVQGKDADETRKNLAELKRSRAWVGINWKGESSTLSGADAIAYPSMDLFNPKTNNYHDEEAKIKRFYKKLNKKKRAGTIIESSEQLSIPELIKRLVTITKVADEIGIRAIERVYPNYNDLNRLEKNEKTGWFVGDGDGFGKYLKFLTKDKTKEEADQSTEDQLKEQADQATKEFSLAMRNWAGKVEETNSKELCVDPSSGRGAFYKWVEGNQEGRVIYAGGDDFLGIFYRIPKDEENKVKKEKFALTAPECLKRLYEFPKVWQSHGHKVTVSVGFVWAYPGVPQRDVLQHCRAAEKAAKSQGRDRLAIRILFNSGNHLEWACPWAYLQKIFEGYSDRNGTKGTKASWTHLYNDIAVLESRHAFNDQTDDITLALWGIYFPDITIPDPAIPDKTKPLSLTDPQVLWNEDGADDLRISSGILGEQPKIPDQENTPSKKLNDWFINLAKVGFHLCSDT